VTRRWADHVLPREMLYRMPESTPMLFSPASLRPSYAPHAHDPPCPSPAITQLKSCREARDSCDRQLERCEAGAASLHSGDERCLGELQRSRDAIRDLRSRLERADAAGSAELARQAAASDSACKERLARAEAPILRRLEEATRVAKECREALSRREPHPERQALEKQLGSLRQKLRLKEELESVIEGKHSKLAEVYKALEAECQNELANCRSGKDGWGAKEGESRAGGTGEPPLASSCSGGMLLLAAVAGYLASAVMPPPQLLVRRLHAAVTGRGRRTIDVDGWALPSTTIDTMKLS